MKQAVRHACAETAQSLSAVARTVRTPAAITVWADGTVIYRSGRFDVQQGGNGIVRIGVSLRGEHGGVDEVGGRR